MSTLKIKIWNTTIGYLAWDGINNRSIFEFENDYLDSKISISPLLLNKKMKVHISDVYDQIFYGLPPVFADSLPDYFGNRIFQTWLEQNNLQNSDLNPIEKLMYVGKRGMGALEYEPGKSLINTIETIDFKEIISVSEKIIDNKYTYSDFIQNQHALQNILTIGSSIGGAQAKILVAIDPKSGEIKAGDIMHKNNDFEYYIVKLSHSSETLWGKEKTSVEYVYYLMAKEAGLHICDSELLQQGGGIHFQTKRFDRVNGKKIHTQTMLAMTGYHNKAKLFSYEQCFVVMEQLQLKHSDKENLYRQMVFNVATCNMDDHLKNIGFIMDEYGKWSLAPSYDLTYPFDPYLPSMKFHKMTINGKSKGILREDLLQVGNKVGIKNSMTIISEVIESVSKFNELAKSFQISDFSRNVINNDIQLSLHNLMIK